MTAPTPLLIRIGVWVWLIAALAVGHFQLLRPILGPPVQLILFALAGLVLLAYRRVPAVRAWVDALDLRALVLLHVTRFVGFYFLLLCRRGELPYAFAVPAGWGDNLTAALALVVCFLPLRPRARLRAINLWNIIGLADILLVVLTAGRIALADPAQLAALTRLPLALLPTFLVPLIIATHVIIFLRLRRELRPVPHDAS